MRLRDHYHPGMQRSPSWDSGTNHPHETERPPSSWNIETTFIGSGTICMWSKEWPQEIERQASWRSTLMRLRDHYPPEIQKITLPHEIERELPSCKTTLMILRDHSCDIVRPPTWDSGTTLMRWRDHPRGTRLCPSWDCETTLMGLTYHSHETVRPPSWDSGTPLWDWETTVMGL